VRGIRLGVVEGMYGGKEWRFGLRSGLMMMNRWGLGACRYVDSMSFEYIVDEAYTWLLPPPSKSLTLPSAV